MEQYTDAQIIEGILHKDSKVVDFIYKRFYGKVERFLIGRGGDPEHIKDVFQEALMVICQKVNKEGLILSCAFSTYLIAVCKNIWMHDMRKKKENPPVLMSDFENINIAFFSWCEVKGGLIVSRLRIGVHQVHSHGQI